MKKTILLFLLVFIFIQNVTANESEFNSFLSWSELPGLIPASGEAFQPGLAGPLVGISNNALIVAGGANFLPPVWETGKVYHDQIYVLQPGAKSQTPDSKSQIPGTKYEWTLGKRLEKPIAYGASVTTDEGIIHMGGTDGAQVFDDVFLLSWQPEFQEIRVEYLPDLPKPCTFSSAALIGQRIYLAGGQTGFELESAMSNFWMLDFSKKLNYKEMPLNELRNLANKRGITLAENEAARLDQEIRNALFEKLFHSDKEASRFSELNKDQLLEKAKQYGLQLDEKASRDDIKNELNKSHWGSFRWHVLPSWPGPARAFNITAAQHNGETYCIYVMSGRCREDDGQVTFLKDVYEFDPTKYDPWHKKTDAPRCVMAGTGIDVGQSHVFILGGADGSLFYKADDLKENHPGFPRRALAYHTITDTWIDGGSIPANHVTTTAVKWNNSIIVPSGEVRPRTRSPKIWKVKAISKEARFGWINFTTLGLYLAAMVGVGIYFSFKNKNTDDYFRGGQKIPWWAAGCSIFATMLSSITYMSIPARAFASNWEYFLGYPAILITAVFVVYFVLPFFRQIDATSAYEYLEKRFNRLTRMIGSALFILFQIGRMAIVMFLSALALAAITPLTEVECILIMGILSIIYCTLGGVEAVIWTDTIQTFVLIGGAFLIFGIILFRIDGGFLGFIQTAAQNGKFHTVNWNWDLLSYTTTAFWVLVLGSFGQNLVSYTSDQAVVQRYMTTSDEKKAAKSIWMNGLMAIPAGLLFFALGAALFVFYKHHPSHLDPTFKTDAIMPLFIARELPMGIAGLIVAGIFAAAQSTISTSMNSSSTTIVTDFFRPFHLAKSERAYLNLARLMTVLLGLTGTGFALLFSRADIKSLFEQFIAVLGLFGGSLGGLFLLGMFTRRANGSGAVIGAIAGAITLYFVKTYTDTHLYLYAFVGITVCFIVGYLASVFFHTKDKTLDGLTIFTIKRK